ncbi:MAG: amidohydrolase [Proteobacteria bacterium]|nr:amidohydrolase [Pseudomonadota bacterium]MCP4921310.1 amidohydrolase [Pseudomonadota bacterium]
MWFLLACTQPADLLVTGTIHVTSTSTSEAMAITDGRVVALGQDALDLGGNTLLEADHVVPGMQDSHTHLLAGSFAMDRLLLLGTPSETQLIDKAETYADENPDEPWIVGYGWLPEQLGEPDGRNLDGIDRPVILVDNSGHSAVVNSQALAIAGIDADTPDPDDGTIVRDEEGDPTGYLIEGALSLVSEVAIGSYDDDLLASGLAPTLDRFHGVGITGVADILALPGFDLTRPWIYEDLDAAGELPIRITWYGPIFSLEDVAPLAEAGTLHQSDRVRFGGGKLWVDGSMGTNTAWTTEAYEDDPEQFGNHYFTADDLVAIVTEAEALSMPLKLHVNGDGAVRAAIEAFEAQPLLTQQHTLEHATLIAEGDLERIRALGLVVSVQPSHVLPASLGDTAESWGDERFGRAYDHVGLFEEGIPTAMGTDWPVWPEPSPLLTSWSGYQHGQRSLDPAYALDGYTRGTAQSLGFTDLGTLEVDMLADFVLLDGDPLDGDLLNEIEVVEVYIGGAR